MLLAIPGEEGRSAAKPTRTERNQTTRSGTPTQQAEPTGILQHKDRSDRNNTQITTSHTKFQPLDTTRPTAYHILPTGKSGQAKPKASMRSPRDEAQYADDHTGRNPTSTQGDPTRRRKTRRIIRPKGAGMPPLPDVNPAPEYQPPIMDQYQASRYLHLSIKTLYNLRRRGEIAYLKFGDSIRFQRTDLDAYAQRNRTPTTGGS